MNLNSLQARNDAYYPQVPRSVKSVKIKADTTPQNQVIIDTRNYREKLLHDRWRTGYHIVAPEGINVPFDPNGAIFWKGSYHLFYIIKNEKGHCWAHISSKDLVHWRNHPVALRPGEGDDGIFSGGIGINREGIPTITYWGLGNFGGICVATSTDDQLDVWKKSPSNPVIKATAWGLGVTKEGEPYGVADPSAIWIKDGKYYLMTGNLLVLRAYGLDKQLEKYQGDRTYLFSSDDLINWKYLHPFYQSDRKWTAANEDDMCPDFFALGNKHMILYISHNKGCQYYLGDYRGDLFYPEKHGRMTWNDSTFFAPESLLDNKGRRIMWAWVYDWRPAAMQEASGWSGEMCLPRVLWLGKDGELKMKVPEELEQLRFNPHALKGIPVPAGSEIKADSITGNSLEMAIDLSPGKGARSGVKVCVSPNREEQTLIYYDDVKKQLVIDARKSSKTIPGGIEAAPFELKKGEQLHLRIFIDKSMLEVFANDRQAVVRRIYPDDPGSVDVYLFSQGNGSRLIKMKAWDMAPSNPY